MAAIVLLAAEGKLSLDDVVREYMSELHDFRRRVKLSHLIHHTSGIRDQWHLLGKSGWRLPADRISNQDIMALLTKQRRLNFEPGSEFMYSNSDFVRAMLFGSHDHQ